MILPPGEKIVEKKICPISGEDFFVTDKDLEFYDKVSPAFNGKKYNIPSPKLCPQERMRRRLAFRNQRKVYLRKSSITGETIFSMHSPEKPYPVYENEIYYSDQCDARKFGKKINFDIPFYKQVAGLDDITPHFARSILLLENSDYCNNANNLKDSYLSFNGGDSEKLYYTAMFVRSEMCVDCLSVYECRECYECVDCYNCERCHYTHNCTRCSECSLCDSCVGCSNCFSCANLTNKQWYIANKPYTKEEYEKQLLQFDVHKQVSPVKKWIAQQPKRYFEGTKTINVIGNHIVNASDIFYCFEVSDCEKLRYCSNIKTGTNCMDVDNFGWHPEWCYECSVIGHHAQNLLFCVDVWNNVSNVLCSMNCNTVSNCFGCCGLHNHEHHCILNTPYSVQEYETLAGKIIESMQAEGTWGEFFPIPYSSFGYNESLAQEYFPIKEDEAKKIGWKWHLEEENSYPGTAIAPHTITEYDERIIGYETAQKNIDELLNGVIKCEVTGKPFKIIRQELAFYIENGTPIPTKHPDQRHKERMALRNPRKLFERHCSECNKDIITTYAPERPEKVVCEECYRKLVY